MTEGLAVRAKLAMTTGSSLGELVKAKKLEKETFFLIDCSASMGYGISAPYGKTTTRMDSLRTIMDQLQREGLVRPMVGFGLAGRDGVGWIETIPQPSGGTPLAEAISFAHQAGAKHLIVISDGEPNRQDWALTAASQFGGPIDVFFVGDAGSRGQAFLAQLSQMTKGQCQQVSLGEPKQLTAAIRGLLGAKAA